MKYFNFQFSTLFAFCLLFSGHTFAQNNPYARLKRDTVFESRNDSIDLATLFWTLDLDEDEVASTYEDYEFFDSERIHYPKVDLTKRQDTLTFSLGSYHHPCKGRVTSRFGLRRGGPHYGIDLKLYTGDPVAAAFDGVVRIALRSRSYGHVVVIRHNNGLETYYAHLSKRHVVPEQVVKAGDIIGLGGNTGISRGAHLHFEVRYLGNPINPEDLIDFESHALQKPDYQFIANYSLRYLKSTAATKYHSVRRGETLGSIAMRYRTSVSKICRLNGISSRSIIRPGQRLRVR